jgi:hypothetical protein
MIRVSAVRGVKRSRDGVRAGDGGDTKSSGPDSSSEVSGESVMHCTSLRDAIPGAPLLSLAYKRPSRKVSGRQRPRNTHTHTRSLAGTRMFTTLTLAASISNAVPGECGGSRDRLAERNGDPANSFCKK